MPDICMCPGSTEPPSWAVKVADVETVVCDKRETCYRHTATPHEYRQSYFMVAPLSTTIQEGVDNKQHCAYYWPTEDPQGTN